MTNFRGLDTTYDERNKSLKLKEQQARTFSSESALACQKRRGSGRAVADGPKLGRP